MSERDTTRREKQKIDQMGRRWPHITVTLKKDRIPTVATTTNVTTNNLRPRTKTSSVIIRIRKHRSPIITDGTRATTACWSK